MPLTTLNVVLLLQVAICAIILFQAFQIRKHRKIIRKQADYLMQSLSVQRSMKESLDQAKKALEIASKEYREVKKAIEKKLFTENYKRVTKRGEK